MDLMFKGATSFNQDISRWNTGRVISMEEMFMDATSFNQNIGNWNTSMVTNMKGMFRNARAFNQNIGNWNVSNVTNMENMLDYSGLSIQNYDLTLIGWASRPVRPNVTLGAMGLKFCNGSNARSILTSPPNNWNIIGDTYECPCVNTPPGQAILNYPINNTIVYSKRVNLVYDTNISGWGNNCNGNLNSHSVHLSQNCSGSYLSLGSVYSIDNLQPNQTYCWFVLKSNGTLSSQSQIQVFRTSDNLVNNVSVISTNRCVNGYIGMLINPIVNNPVRWRISGVIPQNSNLQYITFVMLPTHSESNDRINKNIGITKATTQDNANSVAIDITQNFIRLYSSNNNFITSNNFYSTASPFNNYNVENVNVTLMGNSYTIDFSIKFIENFKSNLYSIYSMAVFRDQANNEYSTNSFSQSSNLVLRRYDTNIGSGIWRVDMVPPTVVSGITRSGAKGQIIKFDPLTYIKSSDLQSGINNNFRYFSVRSLGTNNGEWKLISQNNNITINTNQHINYSSIGQHINPIGLQQIESGAEYEIINTNVNYQARIGLLDNACNFGYRDIMINSLDSSWIATLDGNVYVEKEFRNVNIPDGAVKLGE
jgi:surface protein